MMQASVMLHDANSPFLLSFSLSLYGKPGAYGVVTAPFSVREGINIFLAGFVPTENLRFRLTELNFKVAENVQAQDELQKRTNSTTYPDMLKVQGDFKLRVKSGGFTESEIIVMLGQNGTGKTTFIKMLAGLLKPDDGSAIPLLNVSYKPQKIAPKFEGTVRQLLHAKVRASYMHPQFVTDGT
jgi:ATP-binding cassette subfamily E protein 1